MSKLQNWTFLEESTLKSYSRYTACKDIFQAVCNELGEYYKGKGFRYAQSGPHITGAVGDIKLKMAFWSSRSNTPGSHVNLEVLPSFFSTALAKSISDKNAIIWGHPDVFHRYIQCEPECDVIIRSPFEDDKKRANPNYKNRLKISNNINVYGIDESNFIRLANYVDQHIVAACDILQDEALLERYLTGLDTYTKAKYANETTNLSRYIELKFPALSSRFTAILSDNEPHL